MMDEEEKGKRSNGRGGGVQWKVVLRNLSTK
jgi:hypothetical protein